MRKEFEPANAPDTQETILFRGIVCEAYSQLIEIIEDAAADGRYKALAKTALEESHSWFIKAGIKPAE